MSSCSLFVEESDGFVFTANGIGTCSVKGVEGYDYGNKIIIPEKSPKGLKVTEIAKYGFNFCENYSGDTKINVTQLIIPNTVKRIQYYALGSLNITTLTIPSSVKKISPYAFDSTPIVKIINNSDLPFDFENDYGCYPRVIVDKGGNTTYLKNDIMEYFEDGDGFVYRRYTDDYWDQERAGKYALVAYLGEEQSVVFPENINGSEYIIEYRVGAKKIVIPEGVTSINSAAFEFSNVTHVTIPESVEEIQMGAFLDCHFLEKVVFAEGSQIKSIDYGAFEGCEKLAYLNIPDGIEEINLTAFTNCASLTSINIPESVKDISFDKLGMIYNYEDFHCSEIKVADGNQYYRDIDGNLYNYYATELIFYAAGKSQEKFVVPESVSTIGRCAFPDNSSITSIVIDSSVTLIEYRAFYNCKSLTDIYYTGTEEQWAAISIESDNSALLNATIHCNYVPEE